MIHADAANNVETPALHQDLAFIREVTAVAIGIADRQYPYPGG
jgi:hypothetical protein